MRPRLCVYDATRAEYDRFGGVGISMARQSESPARYGYLSIPCGATRASLQVNTRSQLAPDNQHADRRLDGIDHLERMRPCWSRDSFPQISRTGERIWLAKWRRFRTGVARPHDRARHVLPLDRRRNPRTFRTLADQLGEANCHPDATSALCILEQVRRLRGRGLLEARSRQINPNPQSLPTRKVSMK